MTILFPLTVTLMDSSFSILSATRRSSEMNWARPRGDSMSRSVAFSLGAWPVGKRDKESAIEKERKRGRSSGGLKSTIWRERPHLRLLGRASGRLGCHSPCTDHHRWAGQPRCRHEALHISACVVRRESQWQAQVSVGSRKKKEKHKINNQQ
jgi:hypothetical protein